MNETAGAPSDTPTSARVITVFSPRGGVGKSTIAANLAVGLARAAPLAVVLVDADVQFGDVATVLDLHPVHTLPDLVGPAPTADALLLKTMLTLHPGGFYVVCGAASPVDGDRVTGRQLAHLIDQLREIFRFVIVDTSPGLGEHTLAMIEGATDGVAVCAQAVPSVRALGTELGVLTSLGITPPARHIVVNLVDNQSGIGRVDVEATLGMAVDVSIPRSRSVAICTNRGVAVIEANPRTPAARALLALIARCGGLPSVGRPTVNPHGLLKRRTFRP
nr:P-loop NTPase [Cryobacterium roopkundense]